MDVDVEHDGKRTKVTPTPPGSGGPSSLQSSKSKDSWQEGEPKRASSLQDDKVNIFTLEYKFQGL